MKSELTSTDSGSDKKLIASGIFWASIQLVINQSFAFVIKLILAKLLFPNQFGLVAMAAVFTGFIQVLNDLGIGAALVQRKEETLRPAHYHTAFWTGVIWSVVLFLVVSLGIAPLASTFYHEPLLKTIIPVLSIGMLASPVNWIHHALLTKKMDFKKLAFIDNVSYFIAGSISIVMALMGAGVWALIFNTVSSIFFAIPMYFKATGWKPAFVMEKEAFKDVFGFGFYTTISNILNYLYNNIDNLMIGKLLGATALGVYALAFVLTDTFRTRLMAVINKVMYPIYGKKQNDAVSLKKYYLKVVQFNCLFIFPIMIIFIMEGNAFITQFFGVKWQQTVLPLQILSVSVMFHMLVSGNSALLRGLGRPGLEMKQQIIMAPIYLPTLAYGIYYYGLTGAAYAILLSKISIVIIAQYTFYFLIPVKISVKELIIAIKAPLLASIAGFAALYALNFTGVYYLINCIIFVSIYFGVIWVIMRNELKAMLQGIKK